VTAGCAVGGTANPTVHSTLAMVPMRDAGILQAYNNLKGQAIVYN